ncbi:MAG: glutathione peroxidase [Actinomycetota bacterium]|nr:glutathione peroxidase [Actinomycetota bacterium]
MTNTFDFTVKAADGNDIALSDYSGKAVLIVNVASKCGLTPQYEALEAHYEENKGKGFEIIGFPCNQFGGQEPGTDEEIQEFCSLTYKVAFPVMSKIDVNGEDADPLFVYLRAEDPGDFQPVIPRLWDALKERNPQTFGTDEVKWNFTKFLVGRDGHVIRRYESYVTPETIAADLPEVLG